MIIVFDSPSLRGVSEFSLKYRGNCIKISQGMLLTGTVVTRRDTVARDGTAPASAVVGSRTLVGVFGRTHRNYLQQPALSVTIDA